MTASTGATWAIVIVAVVSIATYLLLVRYAAEHPEQAYRRREQQRGLVQGGQHLGGGRSVAPHRDLPVPEGGKAPVAEAQDVEEKEAAQAAQAQGGRVAPGPGRGTSPMDL
jgi:hypothetical protein